ncbi:MAG: hypothetical protein DRQ88_06035 [Epsilonproteobacteria bacterium]|nr:MAG: hypothetical protein DRQ88_06035 [Campylobacterota bacterium]
MTVQRGRMANMSEAEKKAFYKARASKAGIAKAQKAKTTATVVIPEVIAEATTGIITAITDIAEAPTTATGKVQKGKWTYIPDKELEATLQYDINRKKNVMLTGPTGSGKTSSIYEMAKRQGREVIRVNLNSQTTVHDLIGQQSLTYTTVDGKAIPITKWIYGVLPTAMKKGAWIILDEIDYATQELLGALQQVTEVGEPLCLKEKDGELVYPIEQFRIFATANSVGSQQKYKRFYAGTNNLNQSFLDRFSVYEVKWPEQNKEKKILTKNFPTLSKETIHELTELGKVLRGLFINQDFEYPVSPRRLFDVADRISFGFTAKEAVEKVFRARVPDHIYDTIKAQAQRIVFEVDGKAKGKNTLADDDLDI